MGERQDIFVTVQPQKLNVCRVKDVHYMLLVESDLLQNPELHVNPALIQSLFEVLYRNTSLQVR